MDDTPRGAAANYALMSNKDIKDLPIKDYADPDGCILALWVPSSLLQEGLDTMKAWGFEHKQTYIWVKTKKDPFKSVLKDIFKHFKKLKSWSWTISGSLVKDNLDKLSFNNILAFGMGRLFRQTHEIALIGINNKNIYKSLKNKSQRSVSLAPNLKHSAKPEFLQDSLDMMFPNVERKIELFSRRQRKGWYCLGNESPMTKGENIRDSLNKINLANQNDLLSIDKVISCYDENSNKELFEIWNNIQHL